MNVIAVTAARHCAHARTKLCSVVLRVFRCHRGDVLPEGSGWWHVGKRRAGAPHHQRTGQYRNYQVPS